MWKKWDKKKKNCWCNIFHVVGILEKKSMTRPVRSSSKAIYVCPLKFICFQYQDCREKKNDFNLYEEEIRNIIPISYAIYGVDPAMYVIFCTSNDGCYWYVSEWIKLSVKRIYGVSIKTKSVYNRWENNINESTLASQPNKITNLKYWHRIEFWMSALFQLCNVCARLVSEIVLISISWFSLSILTEWIKFICNESRAPFS